MALSKSIYVTRKISVDKISQRNPIYLKAEAKKQVLAALIERIKQNSVLEEKFDSMGNLTIGIHIEFKQHNIEDLLTNKK